MSTDIATLADKIARGPLSLNETVRVLLVLAAELEREDKLRHGLTPEFVLFDERDNPFLSGDALQRPTPPDYRSPEDVQGQPLDSRADLYALAAVMYHALTGHPPFSAATPQGVLFKQVVEPPRPPSASRPDLPLAVDGVLLKALAKKRVDRYQTASEFASALELAARDAPTPVSLASSDASVHVPIITSVPAPLVAPALAGPDTAHKKRGVGFWLAFSGAVLMGCCLLAYCAPAWYVSVLAPRAPTPAAIVVRPTFTASAPTLTPKPASSIAFWSARFSPDGKQIVTALDDKSVRVWDAATGKQVAAQKGQGDIREDAVYSPDGARILTMDGNAATNQHYAVIWDARLEKETVRLIGNSGDLLSARYNPQGTQIITTSQDGTARLWDAATGQPQRVLVDHDYWIWHATYSPDGKQVATVAEKQQVEVWDTETGTRLASFNAHSAAFSPDGKQIVMAREDKSAWVWDTEKWTKQLALEGHSDFVVRAIYSPDGRHILTNSSDKTARVWDAVTGQPLFVLRPHEGRVSIAMYSPNGETIVTASDIDPVRIWDPNTGKLIATLGIEKAIDAAEFSPDGKQLFIGSKYGRAQLWDTKSWKQVIAWDTNSAEAKEPSSEWPVELADPFDNAGNGWTEGNYSTAKLSSVTKTIASGKYQWRLVSKEELVINRDLPTLKPHQDLAVSVRARRVSGPIETRYGITFRDDYHAYYFFGITDQGSCTFARGEGEKPTVTLRAWRCPAIRPGEENRIKVSVTGSHFTFFVNDQVEGEADDSKNAGQNVALAVLLLSSGDEAAFEFDDFEVRAPVN